LILFAQFYFLEEQFNKKLQKVAGTCNFLTQKLIETI